MWVPLQIADHARREDNDDNPDGEAIDFEGPNDYNNGRSMRLVSVRRELECIDDSRQGTSEWF